MTKTILAVLLLLAGTSIAGAQSTTGSAAGDAAVKAGSRILVEEATKAAGRVFTKEQIRIVKEVLGAAAGANASGTAVGNTDDSDRTSSRRAAGTKGKGKGKGKSKSLPPGLAKKEKLPPGLQKQLEKGGSLPPGLAKRELPPDLEARLGAPAAGTERAIVDNDVVLVEKGTEIVLDVIRDVVRAGTAKP